MKKILYIEDDKELTKAIELVLKKENFTIDSINTGNEGLKLALNNHYDLILLDIMLPDISGWDIFKKLRLKNNKTKILFVSAIPITNQKLKELKKLGNVTGYLEKPFNPIDLLEKIESSLN